MLILYTSTFQKSLKKLELKKEDITDSILKYSKGIGRFDRLFESGESRFIKGRLKGGKVRYVFSVIQVDNLYIPVVCLRKESTKGSNIHKSGIDWILIETEKNQKDIETGDFESIEL